MLLCEAAGFDIVLVETVGVGQSEHQVAGMVDFFLVLMLPGGGDELQGIKKGILELADAIVINKADGDGTALARTTRQHYASAMALLNHPEDWQPNVLTCSALQNEGIGDIWSTIQTYREVVESEGGLAKKRADQNLAWMHQLVDQILRLGLPRPPAVNERLPSLEMAVREARVTPLAAALEVVELSAQR